MSDKQLLQRAWDALAIWKETYPEGWDADDERLLDDLLTRIAQPQREWQTLTENEIKHLWYEACQTNLELTSQLIVHLARNIEAKLKERNT